MESKNIIYPSIPDPNAPPVPQPPNYYSTYPSGAPPSNAGYPQQTGVYIQQQPPFQPTVNIPSNVVIIQPQRWHPLSKSPVSMNCPQCNARIITRVSRQTGSATWLISGGICLAGCVFPILWLGCCLLPFCIDDCKDTIHHCPNCNTYIGTHTL